VFETLVNPNVFILFSNAENFGIMTVAKTMAFGISVMKSDGEK
jgi:ABC-type sulfate/molybdate transport systems ATPase subunit